jgi:hypothetical protein
MPKWPFLPLLLLLSSCNDPKLVRLQVVNDSQEKQVNIAVRCDERTVFDTLVSRFKTSDDRLSRYLHLRPGPHHIVAEARGQHTRLDTIINTTGTNVLGLTFRFDSIGARPQKTYFADGAPGEITFPSFYQRRSFHLYQFQARAPLRP